MGPTIFLNQIPPPTDNELSFSHVPTRACQGITRIDSSGFLKSSSFPANRHGRTAQAHAIAGFDLAPAPAQPILSRTLLTGPLHHTLALDRGSEAR